MREPGGSEHSPTLAAGHRHGAAAQSSLRGRNPAKDNCSTSGKSHQKSSAPCLEAVLLSMGRFGSVVAGAWDSLGASSLLVWSRFVFLSRPGQLLQQEVGEQH